MVESEVKMFFFQAEDGIRDVAVTGVQTCALPISFLAPGKARIHGGGGVENAEGTGVHIEDLDAVAGFVIRVDRHGEESAGFREVLPGVLRNVAKGSIASGGKLAHKHGGADGRSEE